MARGGYRPGSGRKRKVDEDSIKEIMDAVSAPQEVWEKLFAKVKEGDVSAIRVWLAYRYGQPKQTVDVNGDVGIVWEEMKTYASDRETDSGT